jgi:pantoate--beta-alanine ligase
MRTFSSIDETRGAVRDARAEGKTIGFVPTMGALHEGHLSLVREAKREADYTVVSIFVNPAQFVGGEDLDRYPRTTVKDSGLLVSEGADLLFLPDEKLMYPEGNDTRVVPGKAASHLEGAKRPGHFQGVCTIVLKLFNIIEPDKAFFGQKDAQQFAVLNKMTKDLDIPVEMRECPIVREDDGLALSSRNRYLSGKERAAAPVFYNSLKEAEKAVIAGERNSKAIKFLMVDIISRERGAKLDYVEIVDANDFSIIENLQSEVYILVAGYIGDTRLIDNIRIRVN